MGFGSNVFRFEKFKLGNMFDKYKEDPERIFLGANTPFESKVWGKALGKDYEPTVDMWGGATKDDYSKAEEAGIDTKDGRKMHDIARAITSIFAGNAAFGGASAGGEAATAGAEGAAGSGGVEAAGGVTAASSGGGTTAASSSPGWTQYLQMGSQSMGGQQQQRPQQEPVASTPIYLERPKTFNELLAEYNTNAGRMNDGNTIELRDGRAYLKDDKGAELGSAPADKGLYAALNSMKEEEVDHGTA